MKFLAIVIFAILAVTSTLAAPGWGWGVPGAVVAGPAGAIVAGPAVGGAVVAPGWGGWGWGGHGAIWG